MPIFKIGAIEDFTAAFSPKIEPEVTFDAFPTMQPLSLLREAKRSLKPTPVVFEKSGDTRGLALKSLKLKKGFEGLIESIANQTNEIYFLSWAWDFSGNLPYQYPQNKENIGNCIIPLAEGSIREFLGSGIVLFPAREVTAGIAIRIMIWESDQSLRNFGYTIKKVSKTIQKSKLNKLLTNIAQTTNPTIALINSVKEASLELAEVVGSILEKNSDDYVDLFEGYYPASHDWVEGEEKYEGYATEIEISRIK